MANAPTRPAWLANRGVQVLAGAAALFSVVRLVLDLVDGRGSDAFLNFAYAVVFGYVLSESLRARRALQEQRAAEERAAEAGPAEPTD